jgi:hypothetical protein
VRAEDLTSPSTCVLHPDQPLTVAFEEFRRTVDDVLPVSMREEPQRFVGVIRRGDVTDLAIRFRK